MAFLFYFCVNCKKNKDFMKPEKFEESNCTLYGKDCENLPIFKNENQCISKWKLTPLERVKALIFGNIWLSVMGPASPPVWLSVERTVFLKPSLLNQVLKKIVLWLK